MEFTGKEFKAIGSLASTDPGRPSLNGIWIDKSRIFATNGNILIVQKLDDLDPDRTLFVPVDKLKGIKAKDKIWIAEDGVYLFSELGQIKISDNDHARNHSASPPDIDRVIPDLYEETPVGNPLTCLSCRLVLTCMKALEKLGATSARWQLGKVGLDAIRIDAAKLDRETTIIIMPMRL